MSIGCSLDRELLLQLHSGGESLEELLKRYEQKIYLLGYYLTGSRRQAAAVLEDVFVQILRGAELLQSATLVSSEIFKLTIQSAHELSQSESCADDEEDLLAAEPSQARAAFALLPLEYKTAVLLKDVLELGAEESRRALDLCQEELSYRLHRGRLMLRRILLRDKAGIRAGIQADANEDTLTDESLN